ncbi:hypothetical protein [Neorhodopirellula pilleata]|uniref:Uncharacterized protein n=1 Tax=Neorhodopirellula pilleata TaxID=2714738 RepID=A0A5C6A883_9BACT|nr:hypothetical protein [Neorhodopirellula pilleata]TWT95749.1 hypothetical protein Pla100_33910 [Neorhodopirellula pilleata]
MNPDRDQIEANPRLNVDRLAGLIGVRTLQKPTDTPETLDYPRMTEVAPGVAAAMRRPLG